VLPDSYIDLDPYLLHANQFSRSRIFAGSGFYIKSRYFIQVVESNSVLFKKWDFIFFSCRIQIHRVKRKIENLDRILMII